MAAEGLRDGTTLRSTLIITPLRTGFRGLGGAFQAEAASDVAGQRAHSVAFCGRTIWAKQEAEIRVELVLSPTSPYSPKWSEWRQDRLGLPMMQATMGSCR